MSATGDVLAGLRRAGVRAADARSMSPHVRHLPKVPSLHVDGSSSSRTRKLRERLRAGSYAPTPAYSTLVPKRAGGTRSVELMVPEDRVAYEALVRPLRPLVEAALCPRDVVLGPRGLSADLRWWSFSRAPLRAGGSYVVAADIAACAPSIVHRRLAEALLTIGADRPATAAITAFLDEVIGADRGLPLDSCASDCLATAFLAEVDRRMRAEGWSYARCSDDIRVATESEAQAREAVARLSAFLEPLGLGLRPGGTRIVARQDYLEAMAGGDRDRVWELLSQWRDGRVLHSAPATRIRVALRRARAGAGARAAAIETLVDAARAAGSAASEPIVRPALELLTAARDPGLLRHLDGVLARCPSETPTIARYLRSLLSTRSADDALAATARLLRAKLLPTQRAWLYRALLPAAARLGAADLSQALDAATGAGQDWVLRTEAARLLLARGEGVPNALASEAPPQFAAELREMALGRGLALGC